VSVEVALVTHLKTVSAITSLVGSSPSRIRPREKLQDEALPAITYFVVDQQFTSDWSTQNHDERTSRLQIECWGSTRAAAEALYELTWAAMNTFSGVFSGTSIDSARVEIGRSNFERVDNEQFWSYSFDVLVAHSA